MINTSIYDGVGKAKQQFSIDLHCSVNGNCQNDQYIDSVQEMIIFHISLSRLSQMSGERDEILRYWDSSSKIKSSCTLWLVWDKIVVAMVVFCCLSRTISVSASSSLIVSSHGTWKGVESSMSYLHCVSLIACIVRNMGKSKHIAKCFSQTKENKKPFISSSKKWNLQTRCCQWGYNGYILYIHPWQFLSYIKMSICT